MMNKDKDISGGVAKIKIGYHNGYDAVPCPQFEYTPLPKFSFRGFSALPQRDCCSCADGQCSQNCSCHCVAMSTVKLEKKGCIEDADELSENGFDSLLVECGEHCACAGRCGNKLAPANGSHEHSLQIVRTPDKRFVCKTLKPILKGSFVCFLAGEVLPANTTGADEWTCFEFKDESRQLGFLVRLDQIANESRFFSHNCCPNLRPVHVLRDWADPNRPLVAFVASWAIDAGEELTFYYGDYWLLSQMLLALDPNKWFCPCASKTFCVWPAGSEKGKHLTGNVRVARSKELRKQLMSRDRALETASRAAKK